MDDLKFIKSIVISNEYVSVTNKNTKSKSHGQSKLKFKSNSPIFYSAEKINTFSKKSESADNFIFKGKVWFSKKTVNQYFNNILAIYNTNSKNYKNLSIPTLENHKNKFDNKYSKYDEYVCEEYETTNYRYHEQGMKFWLFSELIFYTAIPYVVKVEFYKFTSDQNSIGSKVGDLFFSVIVDFSLLKTDYFNCNKKENYRKHQNKYRKSVIGRDKKCIITGVENNCALEACHILPYILSNDKEKYDINNGLTLTSTIHKFFDEGLISFEPTYGEIKLSELLSINDVDWIKQQINYPLRLSEINDINFQKMQIYLKFHYENIFRKY